MIRNAVQARFDAGRWFQQRTVLALPQVDKVHSLHSTVSTARSPAVGAAVVETPARDGHPSTWGKPTPASPALEGIDLGLQQIAFVGGGAFLGALDLSNGLRVRPGNRIAGVP